MEVKVVTLEVAKLAREKKFNWEVFHYYLGDSKDVKEVIIDEYSTDANHYCELGYFKDNWNDAALINEDGGKCYGCNKSDKWKESCSAPTQDLLVKWFREVHNIEFEIKRIVLHKTLTYVGKIVDWRSTRKPDGQAKGHELMVPANRYPSFAGQSYEESLETGLLEALKLI